MSLGHVESRGRKYITNNQYQSHNYREFQVKQLMCPNKTAKGKLPTITLKWIPTEWRKTWNEGIKKAEI